MREIKYGLPASIVEEQRCHVKAETASKIGGQQSARKCKEVTK